MNHNKATIFKSISNNEAISKASQADSIEAFANGLLDQIGSMQPPLPYADRVKCFHQRINSDKIAASIESIETIEHLPASIQCYLSNNQLAADIALQPTETLINLDLDAFNIKFKAGSNEQVAVTMGHWGIAETGSIVIHSAPDSPVLLNFLASHHIIVIHEKNILANLEDYAARIHSLNEHRMVCLITGASGTTDIEGVLVNGAHGPEHLHIITIKDSI